MGDAIDVSVNFGPDARDDPMKLELLGLGRMGAAMAASVESPPR